MVATDRLEDREHFKRRRNRAAIQRKNKTGYNNKRFQFVEQHSRTNRLTRAVGPLSSVTKVLERLVKKQMITFLNGTHQLNLLHHTY